MSSSAQSAIIWPKQWLPGTTDNFVSNEIIAVGIKAEQIWPLLADPSKWESYYENCEKITPPEHGGLLRKGDHFSFSTFGFPVLPCVCEESEAPHSGTPGRIAWSAHLEGDEESKVGVYHAWVVEDIEHNRVRILTQESQSGKPAAELSIVKPNKMLLGHQDWLEGLIGTVTGQKVEKTNLTSIGGV